MVKLIRYAPVARSAAHPAARRSLDEMVNDLWGNWSGQEGNAPALRPALDVVEEGDNLLIKVNLPGLSAEDVNVEIEGDMLTISGEFASEEAQEGQRYHYRERRSGSFRRALRLADTVDTQGIEATFANGVLTLSLPRVPEAQPQRIAVRSS